MRACGRYPSRLRAGFILFAVLTCLVGFIPAGAVGIANGMCAGKPVTVTGTEGDDVLTGTAGNDVIVGLGGKDVIHGGGGNDTICGGLAADRIYADAGNDTVLGEGGHDIIRGGPGLDTLNGGLGNDAIYGGPGSDTLIGGGGDDLLDGMAGGNIADGGDGVDACFNASDTTDTCEPKWLEWDEELEAVDDATHDGCYDLYHPVYSRSFPEYADIDGKVYYQNLAHVFQSSYYGCLYPGDWIYGEYILGRDYRRFVATLGLDDLSLAADVPVRYEVFGDGVLLFSRVLNYGEHYDLNLDVTGVLRLKLRTTLLAEWWGDWEIGVVAVFGSPIVSANKHITVYPPVP